MENEMRYDVIETPIGPLTVAADETGLRRIFFPSGGKAHAPEAGWVRDPEPFGALARELAEYFAGRRRAFSVALAPEGTEFQLATWHALTEIPYGTTISYAELARRIGRPAASRAVGAANGANPLPIVVPCHRVIGADGSLTGFGGGLPLKRALLELERAACLAPPRQLRLL
jgi:methylated-DNA-[protein]-cysteine S-methyltransferase